MLCYLWLSWPASFGARFGGRSVVAPSAADWSTGRLVVTVECLYTQISWLNELTDFPPTNCRSNRRKVDLELKPCHGVILHLLVASSPSKKLYVYIRALSVTVYDAHLSFSGRRVAR